ncbi:unnamed protein product [Clavelina lepadiformis]|uniref:A disintegrin and metalloproteinase with thrombospondin motifs 18 n=1 Tax=Clavelina lepadiformis TaxID=159417 RepID=A0ABP0GM12_CLALP
MLKFWVGGRAVNAPDVARRHRQPFTIATYSFLSVHCLVWSLAIMFCSMDALATASERRIWPSHYTGAHHDLHKRIQQTTHKHLEDFEIVVPALVDQEYRHVTYHVRHKRINRVRRDVIDDIIDTDELGLRYAVSGFGHNFRVHLESNKRLFAPTFSVKRVRRDAEEVLDKSKSMGCHYHGRVTSHKDEIVAMSTCEGLTGLIRTDEDDFIVEPVAPHVNHSFVAPQQPHILYKRQHLDKGKHRLHYCGKKHRYPVTIPESESGRTIKVLSSGEIELEEEDLSSNIRRRRSLDVQGYRENDVDNYVTENAARRPESKNVETLVVADRDMIRNHERDHRDITTYVLTVMNMVSGLFLDRTLDGEVNIVLVGLMLMEDNEGLHLDHKADRSLASFCAWQSNLNQSAGKKPDHSILLTGIDICVSKNSPCETLGLAQVGGMCSERDSCTINEDMGLGLAFTVAHETGHSFGMKHDGQSNFCSKRDGHIMSPTLNGLNGVFTWSACSREAMNDFLSDANSVCLDDHPVPLGKLNFPDRLPGEIYDGEEQCKWQFGVGASLCAFRYKQKKFSICKILWCEREGSNICETKYMPAAEGTQCGMDMWCRRGVCVAQGTPGPQAIDGAWSDYVSWTPCTRTCGGGVQYKKRYCNNPEPRFGGRHCDGRNKIFQMCNTKQCPPSQIDFRSQQCAEFNNRPYRRRYYNWVPFTKYSSFGRDQCELLCKAERYDFFDMLSDQVVDGTPCDASSKNVCIQGKCMHVGCDYVLGSNATEDMCGVCNGDNSTCETVTGTFADTVRRSGYYEVVRIPRGAYSVRIWEERCCTHSYIAIRSAVDTNRYYLNGNWRIDLYGKKTFAGSDWKYNRRVFKSESISTSGPLKEDLIVEVLIIVRNPGISYTYSMQAIDNNLPDLNLVSPKTTPMSPISAWNVTYTTCSQSCGGGTQKSNIFCLTESKILVDDDQCDPSTKPVAQIKHCNTIACPPRWATSEWGQCSRSCDGGFQTRQVTCKEMTSTGDAYTHESRCDVSRKPPRNQKCNERACPTQWHVGPWSKCSHECGRGSRTRSVQCRSGLRVVRNAACDRSKKPKRKESCLIAYCIRKYQWFITAWEQCSATCGTGVQTRELQCSYKNSNGQYRRVGARRCKRVRQPGVSLQKECSLAPCPEQGNSQVTTTSSSRYQQNYRKKHQLHARRSARWIAGTWQKCSVSCGGGYQTRAVRCLQSGQSSNACAHHRKPPSRRSCNTYKCNLAASHENSAVCVDKFSWCSLVPQHGQCNHSYFGLHCCQSCTAAG